MKYPCSLIQDLLPLYFDGVCSDESSEIIKMHLNECTECKDYYTRMCDADNVEQLSYNENQELQKAHSFKVVKKKMRTKQFVLTASVVLLIFVIAFSVITLLKSKHSIIAYDNNVTVDMLDQNLVARLSGSTWCESKSVRIEVENNGQQLYYIFFNLSETKWDALAINDQTFTEYIICPADKGAKEIDYIYYYTGDFNGIDTMTYAELQSITKDAVLLWSK